MNRQERDAIEAFGKLLMAEVRDEAIQQWEMTINGVSRASANAAIHKKLQSFNAEQIQILRTIISLVVDTTLDRFLWMLEQNQEVKISCLTVENLAKVSDGLSGELYSNDGWIQKYSKQLYV